MCVLSNGPVLASHDPPSPKPEGANVPLSNCRKMVQVNENVNRAHLRTHWLDVKTMPWTIVRLSPIPPNEWTQRRRSSTICVVVERLDHRCGVNLVFRSRHDNTSWNPCRLMQWNWIYTRELKPNSSEATRPFYAFSVDIATLWSKLIGLLSFWLQYLELRFSKGVRVYTAIVYIVQTVVYSFKQRYPVEIGFAIGLLTPLRL